MRDDEDDDLAAARGFVNAVGLMLVVYGLVGLAVCFFMD